MPVEAIAEDFRSHVVEEVTNRDVSGLLIPAERRIFLNRAEPPLRRRFTPAHELGHRIFQRLRGQAVPIYCRLDDLDVGADPQFEREANVFAAEPLMPETAVREQAKALTPQLRERFAVSQEAISCNIGLTHDAPVVPRAERN